ncbi:unnamed protein product [Didymodactylos carnosus]|uniref:Uncharacterized protein n=1 Tax=Didymodactylos carnosus TaxID=1234261 RepID=A0A813RHK5_9BILA|nr:unnamed protein product [Didymodactylos carnosus]CAF3564447.1 unnamed protein product [Didymodactylos carnosus]
MPIPLDKVKVVQEIERLEDENEPDKKRRMQQILDSNDEQLSFIHSKHRVHWHNAAEIDQDLLPYHPTVRNGNITVLPSEQSLDVALRRRYMAHWGLPEWLGDNHFLLQKHRPPANSIRECLISIASIHSETVNIWTHLIGALCISVTFILFLLDNNRQMDISDFITFSSFFISAILCLSFSTLLHIFLNYSPRIMVIVSKLDYFGINILIFGSMIPVLHYYFYCNLKLKAIYIGILLLLSIASVIGTSSAACSKPRCRPFKATLFIVLGLYGVVPTIHACIIYGMHRMIQMGFLYLCVMAVSYIFGGVMYGSRMPERFFPGKFDIIGQSHQVLHVAVLIAIYFHFYACCRLFNYVVVNEKCIEPIMLKQIVYAEPLS